MSEPERTNMFYVSATAKGKGYTMDPAQAVVDLTGAPVIAPGYVLNLMDEQDQRYMRSLEVQQRTVRKVWDLLLDEMEDRFLLEEDEAPDYLNSVNIAEAKIGVLHKALAILEFGHDYKQDPEATIQRVAEIALARYDQESYFYE